MRIFRFDPEVSIPIEQFGSDFRIGPLTGPDARVRVQVLHLAAGGLIGRHPTAVQQLFAVVAGEAEVSGADGAFTTIGPGRAALWEIGEDHQTRSPAGCTAIGVEGAFDMLAVAVTQDIVVLDHDPAWADWFEQLAALRDRRSRQADTLSTIDAEIDELLLDVYLTRKLSVVEIAATVGLSRQEVHRRIRRARERGSR